jgi:acetyltransferase-like isoleucine patch superfamily enzyme
MKTEPLDFLLACLVLGIVGALAFAVTALAAVPVSRTLFGEYHLIADVLSLALAFGLIAAIAVRLILRGWPLTPGDYSMDDSLFTRWKLIVVVSEFGRLALVPFTSEFARPVVARLFGAKVGRDTALGGGMTDLPFISVGDGCVLGRNSVVTGHAITSGRIVLRDVTIRQGATVGVGAVVMPGVEIGEGSVVAAGSVVTLGTRIPPGELWAGSPARRIKEIGAGDIRG